MLARAIAHLAFGDIPGSPPAAPKLGDEHSEPVNQHARQAEAILPAAHHAASNGAPRSGLPAAPPATYAAAAAAPATATAAPAVAAATDPKPAKPKKDFSRSSDPEHSVRAGLRSHGRSLLSASHGFALMSHANKPDPKSRAAAQADDSAGWTAAELKELSNHQSNRSWTEIDRCDVPSGRKLVKLVWVYKRKRDGSLKARLCVQGCAQIQGVDYHQTFCAAMRSSTLRLLSSLAAKHGLGMRRWDFVSAYLQGELEAGEVVYCYPPPGHGSHTKACRVEKPIYGMAQAGRRWQRTIFPWIVKQGFEQLDADPCVFIKRRSKSAGDARDETVIIGCYVDDLFVLYSHDDDQSLYREFTTELTAAWKAEDEGEVTDLLNVEISATNNGVELRQTNYIMSMASAHLLHGQPPDTAPFSAKASRIPAGPELVQNVADAVSARDTPEPALLQSYQSLVGGLLYCATHTRPDIAYSVGMLCRAMAFPTHDLLRDAHRVLVYLLRTKSLGLRYEAEKRDLRGATDSDWDVGPSTTGYVFMYNSAAISWGSKKQATIALSSCEAEIVAASEGAKEALYLRKVLHELSERGLASVEVACDNKGAIDVAYNPEHFSRMKHVARRHFFVRECVEQGSIHVPYVKSAENPADFFTKPLPYTTFAHFRDRIMNTSCDSPSACSSRGGIETQT